MTTALALRTSSLAAYPTVSLPSPTQFEAYARAANALPMLSAEHEADLLEQWIQRRSPEAARQLVLAHLRLVVKTVRAHAGYGLSSGDMAQEGTLGLMKAIQRFRPDVGVRLAAFALRWIEAEIREFIFRSWRMVRLGSGRTMRKLFFGYRKTVNALHKLDPTRRAGVTPEEIATALGVSPEQAALASSYFRGSDISLDGPSDEADSSPNDAVLLLAADASSSVNASSADSLSESGVPFSSAAVGPVSVRSVGGRGFADDFSSSLEASSQTDPQAHAIEAIDTHRARQAIAASLGQLSPRERRVLHARRLSSPATGLKQLAEELGVSMERVRQIEIASWNKLVRLAQDHLSLPSSAGPAFASPTLMFD